MTRLAGAATIPGGSVVLNKAALKKVESVQCGKVKGKWIPGTLYKSKYFVSHTQQSKNFAKAALKAKGKSKTKLQRTSVSWKSRATSGLVTCSSSMTNPVTTTVPGDTAGSACVSAGSRNVGETLECRKFAGNAMKWVSVSANPVAPVRAAGSESVSDCQLADPATKKYPGFMVGFPAITTNLPLTGKLTIGFIPIDFPDVPGEYAPLSEAQEQMDQFSAWMERVSGGRVTVTFRTSSVWSRVPSASTSYGLARSSWGQSLAQDGVNAVDASFDFSGLSAVFFYLPRTITAVAEGFNQNDGSNGKRLTSNEGEIRFWFGAGQYFYREGFTVWSYLAHEIMHSFGLVDLYVRSWSSSDPQPMRGYDIMASQDYGRTLAGWSRFLLGWYADNQVYCMKKSSLSSVDVTLVPIDRSIDGHKAVMIPLSATKVLVVESRRREFFLTTFPLGSDGVIAYVVDVTVENGEGSSILQIPANHGTINPAGKPPLYDAFIRVGESITVDGVTVAATESGDYDTVRISK